MIPNAIADVRPIEPDAAAPRGADFYSPSTYCAEESVGYVMKRVMLSIVHQVDKRLGAHDLTSAQWGPLLRLRTVGPSTVADLARWVQVDAGAMTRLLDRLERKGLCRRVRSTDDRRVVQVELTAEGEAAIEHVPAALAEVMNLHLAGFSRREWQTLKALLGRMADNGDALRESR
ncbi:MAG: MarR family winged helix-turn-helix transcriptional regulator [Lautropia sp.]